MTQQLLPDLPGFSIEQITIAHGVITVLARSQMTSGHCPECVHLLGKRATLIGIRSGESRICAYFGCTYEPYLCLPHSAKVS